METTVEKQTEKLINAIKTGHTPYVICPKCGRGRMQYGYGWECLFVDCGHQTFEIPPVSQIKELIQLKENLKKVKEWKI